MPQPFFVSDTPLIASSRGYNTRGRAAQEKVKLRLARKKGWSSLRTLRNVLLAATALFAVTKAFKHTELGNLGYWCLQRSCCTYGSIVFAMTPTSSGYVFAKLADDTAAWAPPDNCTAPAAGSHVKKDALQSKAACFSEEFAALQLSLARTLSDTFPPAVLETQNAHSQWAGLAIICSALLWLSFKLQLLPGQELLQLWIKEKQFRPRSWPVWALAVLAVRLIIPGLAMHLYIQGACDQLEQKQQHFYWQLQTAAVMSLYVPDFKCRLLQRDPIIPTWLLDLLQERWVQTTILIPVSKLLFSVYAEISHRLRLARAVANGENDCVNFSLNMIHTRAGLAQDAAQGDQTHILQWRTLCEVKSDELIPNAELRRKITEAASYTTGGEDMAEDGTYPFLHTLQPRDMNLLLLNRISQLVGAYRYFALNEADDLGVQPTTYCFGMTCENYAQGKRHEKKLRVMIIKKSVLRQIESGSIVHEVAPHNDNDTTGRDAKAGSTPHKRLAFDADPAKGMDRWRTLRAMAHCFHDEDPDMVQGWNSRCCVGTVEVPYFV